MAKIIVEIEINNRTVEELKNIPDFFPKPNMISIDNTYLKIDPNDDSFYLFKVLEMTDD